MLPVTPVLADEFQPDEVLLGADQPQYSPLPALRSQGGVIMSRWTLSDAERKAVAEGADIYLSVLTFNMPPQPVYLEAGTCDRSLLAKACALGLLPDYVDKP